MDMFIEHCSECGVSFGMTEGLNVRLRKSGKTFYCLNGHSQHYRDDDMTRLKSALANLTVAQDARDYERRGHEVTLHRLAATQGVVTKLRKAIEVNRA